MSNTTKHKVNWSQQPKNYWLEQIEQLQQQRDELLAACRALHADLYDLVKSSNAPLWKYISLKQAVTAIARAEGRPDGDSARRAS